MKKKNMEFAKAPKLSAKKIINSNWFLIKLVLSASPVGILLYALEQFRVQVFIFIEHTWLIKTVLDCIQYKKPFSDTLFPIIMVVVLLMVSSILGSVVGQWLLPKAKLKAVTKLKNMLFEKAHDVDLEYFDDPAYYNDFIMTTEKAAGLVDYILNIISVVSMALGTVLTTGVYFAAVSPGAFIIVALSAAITLVLALTRSKYNYSKYALREKYGRRTGYIKRLFYLSDYAKELRLNREAGERAFDDYDEACEKICGVIGSHNKRLRLLTYAQDIMDTVLFELIFVLFLAYQASVLEVISYATMVVMMRSVYSVRWAFTSVILRLANSAENCMYVEKVREFLRRDGKIKSSENLPVSHEPCSLELKNVSFKYNDTDGNVINNVSLSLRPKEKIAIVGYNGAGKTTLTKLLLRLYDPTEGEIFMDGRDIKRYDVSAYRHNIGVVFQDFNLYGGTVRENVVMDVTDCSDDDRVLSALSHSGFDERLDKMPDGLDTELTAEFDDNGVNLSGGEAQKIAIARAFYKNSGLIILDEPSSALDPIAEYNFNMYMREAAKDSTVIFISHRLSTTRLADRIVVMENGSVCEEGDHETLLAAGGKYAEMWHTQADKYVI